MDELLFRNSPVKTAALALCAAGFVATPLALMSKVPLYQEVILWIGAVFFSACLVALVVRLLATGPPMRFSRDGFEASCYGIPFIPWTDVEMAWTARVKSSRLLCLKLRNPESILTRLSAFRRRGAALNRKLGYGDVCLATTGMKPGFAEMLEYARKHIPDIQEH
jgi:hypothetical protein